MTVLAAARAPALAAVASQTRSHVRPTARGKFLWSGDEKLYLRGVTYGTFRPGADGSDYPEHVVVESDFAAIAAEGFNCVRTYTVPPRRVLDAAHEHGLRMLVGLPWEQHVAFLDDRGRARSIEQRVREGVRACAAHPAVLGYAIGNEIPAAIVRWHGRRRVERFIERLYHAAKEEDPAALVTYVNYPTTEYLQLPFLDLVAFNVYLEAEELLEAYVARLQNLADERPLLLTEIGFDSRRHGTAAQAVVIGWQVRTAFAAGCAGTFVFSWTDEWHRGGNDVDDWDFGLVDRAREPKASLTATRDAMLDAPFREDLEWPSFSVVVCTHNGAATLRECLDAVTRLDYPDFECIVVDDGSTDGSGLIAEEFAVQVIRTPNEGLASARNHGLVAARGEIVAYIDDDAYPDPHWLRYLATAFMATPHAAVGGPNIAPEGDGIVADCVARAPGGPTHVLVSDREAEHIPGCNMAIRREALEAIGGFDPQYRIAGDDVDICWRLHERGWTIGFSPAAVVWHHRRRTVRAYLRQQRNYGKAEALLEREWPRKYNRGGHPSWAGRVYGSQRRPMQRRWRIYYGTWGSSLFQSIYERPVGRLSSLPAMPEWYLLLVALAALSVYSAAVSPVFFVVPGTGVPLTALLLALTVLPLLWEAVASGRAAWIHDRRSFRKQALTALLYLGQPLARVVGRLGHGLTPWRRRSDRLAVPRRRDGTVWCDTRRSLAERLSRLESELRHRAPGVETGGSFDRWDIQLAGGSLGAARLRMTVEEHGAGQLVRYRVWPRASRAAICLIAGLLCLASAAFAFSTDTTAITLAIATLLVAWRAVHECAAAVPALFAVLETQADSPENVAESAARDAEALPRGGSRDLPPHLAERLEWYRERVSALSPASELR